jgi:hypothetical protein
MPVSGRPIPADPKLRYALVLGLGTIMAQMLSFYGVL